MHVGFLIERLLWKIPSGRRGKEEGEGGGRRGG